MQNNKGKEKKKDSFTGVMITQSLVCTILIILLIACAKSPGAVFQKVQEQYGLLMAKDFTVEDFKDAFNTVKDYVYTYSPQGENHTATEPAVAAAGGDDLEFSGLDALEGVSFGDYDLGFTIAEPLKSYEITSGFGYRVSPITGETGFHTGLDMAAEGGDAIYAAASGTVLDAAYDDSYGYYVKLSHGNNTVTIYAHCSRLTVSEGDRVEQGDKIALVGSTGSSTGNHLHFEMRKDNIRIDPSKALFSS